MKKGIFDNTPTSPDASRAVVVARFETSDDASKAREVLEDMFDEMAEETERLFEKNGGEAHVYEIARIYAVRGLRNDSGWEQELPLLSHDKDLAWTLPTGAYIEDAENLMWTLGATDVAIHQNASAAEEWKLAPHPMAMGFPEDEIEDEADGGVYDFEDDEPRAMVAVRKRTLH